MDGDAEDLFGVVLTDNVVIELRLDFAGRGNPRKKLLAGTSAAFLLVEDRLAKLDALAADVHIARPFDERPDIAITLAAKRTECVALGGAGSAAT
jgi:hypothetical protein